MTDQLTGYEASSVAEVEAVLDDSPADAEEVYLRTIGHSERALAAVAAKRAGGGGGGGSSPITVVRQSVHYTDFAAPVDGNSFAAVHAFATGDVVLRMGWVCTETFNDSNHGSLGFQMTDADNGIAITGLGSGGTANAGTFPGLRPLEYAAAATDATPWDALGQSSTDMALVSAPWTIGISDNGLLARDGSTGNFEVVVVYIPVA